MEYAKEISRLIQENKDKDITVSIPSNHESVFGKYCTIIFKINGKDFPYIFPVAMVLSMFQFHIISMQEEMDKTRQSIIDEKSIT